MDAHHGQGVPTDPGLTHIHLSNARRSRRALLATLTQVRRALTALVPPALVVTAAVVAIATQNWHWWLVEELAPMTPASTSFGDLANITATADCMQAAVPIESCDPYGREFQPYVVLPARMLAWLGLGTAQTGALGLVLVAIYVATVAALALVLTRGWRGSTGRLALAQVLLGLAASSPATMLALERGQIEILTLSFALLAWLGLSAQRTAPRIAGAFGAVAAVVSKFFAVGVFAPFVTRRRPNAWVITAAVASIGALVAMHEWVQQASAASHADLPATSRNAFGAATLVATWLSGDPLDWGPGQWAQDNWATVRVLGIVIALLAVALAFRFAATPAPAQTDDSGRLTAAVPWLLLVGSVGVLWPPYLLGASHDYRLVFLLPALVAALLWHDRATESRAVRTASTLIAALLVALATSASMTEGFFDFIWPRAAIIVGDIALLAALAIGAAAWLRGLFPRRG